MGTEDEIEGMVTQVDACRQDHTTTEPEALPPEDPPAGREPEAISKSEVGSEAVAASAVDPAVFVKTKERIRRPPLCSTELFDAFRPKPHPPIRKPVVVDDDFPAATPEPAPAEDPRQIRSELLTVSQADAVTALEAWSALSLRRRPGKAGG